MIRLEVFGEAETMAAVADLLDRSAEVSRVRLADALSSPQGHLLLFGLLPERPLTSLPPSVPTDETSGYEVLYAPADLAFPLHTVAARSWFAGRYG